MISKSKARDRIDVEVKDGVYFGLQGPTFETLAEYKMVKFLVQIALGCLLSRRLLWLVTWM
jgi:purine nucleoside phosphorylase